MNDRNIDDVLQKAAGTPNEVDPALLDRISASIQSTLRPVRPMPPVWMLVFSLILICGSVALAGASALGMYGLLKMSAIEMALIFTALGILVWLAASLSVSEMTPGSRVLVSPTMLAAGGSLSLIVIFAALFYDYSMDSFVPKGIACLRTGLLLAIPVGIASWLILRRGFAVNATAAGLAAGTLAGIAGVIALELHCPNFHAMHVMVWHTAVVPLSGLVGAGLAWAIHKLGRR